MGHFGDVILTADWKSEKHVPVIECADEVQTDTFFPVKVTLGKAIAHPNTTEHHIRWIALYFLPQGAKALVEIGKVEFTAHGESTEGPNKGTLYTNHEISLSMKTGKSGTLYALAYCNIHGVWGSTKELKVR